MSAYHPFERGGASAGLSTLCNSLSTAIILMAEFDAGLGLTTNDDDELKCDYLCIGAGTNPNPNPNPTLTPTPTLTHG